MHWFSLVGIFLIAIGTALTYLGQKKDGDQAGENLRGSNMQIEKLSTENIELTKRVADLNNEIAAIVTGGDSYCYIEPLLYGVVCHAL